MASPSAQPMTPTPSGAQKTFTPEEQQTFNELVAITGSTNAAISAINASQALYDKSGFKEYGVTPAEAALMVAYTGNSYAQLNAQLRAGVMDEKQWIMANGLNGALSKLPDHKGTVYRRTSGPSVNVNLYKEGMIVEERAFTSTSTKSSFVDQGAVKYYITSKTGKSIEKISKYGKNESEVLFRSGTRFKIQSVTKGKTSTVVKMEEVGGR
jgi:hypothetical protein